jgi:hypothetical protein
MHPSGKDGKVLPDSFGIEHEKDPGYQESGVRETELKALKPDS